jgi:PHD/YefM family antitoxin component YafN of YafNO toxin-antitoxin module
MGTKTTKKSSTETRVRYIVNTNGEKTEVVLPIKLYEQLIEELEELEDIRDFDEAMKNPDFIPWEEAKKQLGV